MKAKVIKVYIDKDSKERMMPGQELDLSEARAKQLKDKGFVELIENTRKDDKNVESKKASVQSQETVGTEKTVGDSTTEGAV